MIRVKEYFDEKACGYDAKRKKGAQAGLVAAELDDALQLLQLRKGEKVLECGCGTGIYGEIIVRKGCNYTGIDISAKMIAKSRKKGLRASVADMHTFKSRDKFDKILISGSLEFCDYPKKAFSQCAKNLKEKGSVVLIAPRFNLAGLIYRLFHSTHGIQIKLFSIRKIRKIAESSGLRLVSARKPNTLTWAALMRR